MACLLQSTPVGCIKADGLDSSFVAKDKYYERQNSITTLWLGDIAH
jgi:hypothetical protein